VFVLFAFVKAIENTSISPLATTSIYNSRRVPPRPQNFIFHNCPTRVGRRLRPDFPPDSQQARKTEEFGDLPLSLVNLARHERIEPEAALREATKKFDRRFRKVEAQVEASEKPFSEFTLDELDAIWDKVKSQEKLPS
jgi:hypothetical protein